MKLFLVGMPGCGKSTMGAQLAHDLLLPFIDLDTEIAQRESASIEALFNQKGEDFFRRREHDILTAFCRSDMRFVMATGGGTPCFFSNMTHINRAGISLFLDVPVKELCKRLSRSPNMPMPLLPVKGQNLSEQRVVELRDRRITFYRQANFIFLGRHLDKQAILNKVRTSFVG